MSFIDSTIARLHVGKDISQCRECTPHSGGNEEEGGRSTVEHRRQEVLVDVSRFARFIDWVPLAVPEHSAKSNDGYN
jgi:hypothetical protein